MLFYYPAPYTLTLSRLSRLLYLADYESVRVCETPLTDIIWYKGNYSPESSRVAEIIAQKGSHLHYRHCRTPYSTHQTLDALTGFAQRSSDTSLSPRDKAILRNIIESTVTLLWNELSRRIYQTPPWISTQSKQPLNLRLSTPIPLTPAWF